MRFLCVGAFALFFLSAGFAIAGGQGAARHFALNEDLIRDSGTPADPRACNPAGVLSDLFRQIGPVAHVYPSENYYYFQFFRGGKSYSGDLRLGVDFRDKGQVQFICYETYASWLEEDMRSSVQRMLSSADGVIVRKAADLQYDVTFHGATVRFMLNKLDQTPDNSILRMGEAFVGRCLDDSGIAFDLVYNKSQKAFYYVLDTKGSVRDAFVAVRSRVYIGKRTGFVFFEDAAPKRYVLIAVNTEEVYKNSPYDGPFDHLPENYYGRIGFWHYVNDAFPQLIGKLTAGGTYRDSELIFGITAYREYGTQKDLSFIDECLKKHLNGDGLLSCLI